MSVRTTSKSINNQTCYCRFTQLAYLIIPNESHRSVQEEINYVVSGQVKEQGPNEGKPRISKDCLCPNTYG